MSGPGVGAISTEEAAVLVGVSIRQLDHWARKGWVDASLHALGSGRYRRWTPEMVRRARALAVASEVKAMEMDQLADWIVNAIADAAVAGVVARERLAS